MRERGGGGGGEEDGSDVTIVALKLGLRFKISVFIWAWTRFVPF